MNDCVSKPVEPEVLRHALLEWLTPGRCDTLAAPGVVPRSETSSPSRATPDPLSEVVLKHLTALPGMDPTQGLAALGGSPDKYLALLCRFVANHRQAPSHMADAAASGDYATIRRMAHELKGVSATLGARRLAETAEHLDASIHTEPRLDAHRMHDLIEAIEQAFAELDAALEPLAGAADEAPAPGAESAFDAGEARSLLDTLAALLRENDTRAIGLIRTEAGCLRDDLGADFNVLRRLTTGFEFEEALRLVERHRAPAHADD